METIKLKEKQLLLITQIEQQKAQLTNAISTLNEKENAILEVIFEAAGVTGQVANVTLEDGHLKYEVVKEDKQEKSKKKS